jgi:hypothetical protein
MKNLIKSLFVCVSFSSVMTGCVKNSGSIQTTGTGSNSDLTLSKSDLKRGEQLIASTNQSNPNAIVKWTTYPSANTVVLPANNQAGAIFASAGSYRITASYYNASDTTVAYDSSSAPVTVNDSINSPAAVPDGLDSVSLAGDQLILSPISASDSIFIMSVQTVKLYNCTPFLAAYSFDGLNGNSLLLYSEGEVVEGSGCNGAKNPAVSYLFFIPLNTGTYNISAVLNSITYTGSLTVTATDYIFTWNYTSGITISPLQIKRN